MLQPDTVHDINFNAAKCIQEATHFGYTEYTNICNHTSSIVKWGGVDWVLCIGGLALGAVLLIAMFGLVLSIARE